jgi:peptidoglycan/LPS O-acetylase OafA/YrhL
VTVEDAPASPATSRPTAGSRGGRGPRLRHRPALDGLRGLAVASCLTYQMVPGQFAGGWLGIDMFLTLSGFFIAAMLLQEQRSTGRVDYWRFIKRRGRRLLPGHLLLLFGTVVLTWWLMPVGRWTSVAGDIAASVVEMVNWRFISAEQSYFNNISLPSPLRHMWSLSVQEQYYVVFPLVLLLLSRVARTRRTRIAFFMGLIGLSLWRMNALYEPGTDPSRVYFGTDTRIFEVLIGVVGAYFLSERAFAHSRGRQHRGWLTRWDRALGWAGLGSLALLFWFMTHLSERSPWLFQGGLAAVCGLTMVAIVAASSPQTNFLQRILSWRVLRWIGRMGFSLYIWHWPLVVFTTLARPEWSTAAQRVVSMSLTVGIAWLSNRFVETPIHEKGLRGWLPWHPRLKRVLVVGAVPAILLGAFQLDAQAMSRGATGTGLDLALPAPAYTAGSESLPVVVVGNSIAAGLAGRGDASRFTDLRVDLVASLGCDPWVREERQSADVTPPRPECLTWRRDWPGQIRAADRPYVLYVVSPNLLPDYRAPDGSWATPPSAEHDRILRGILDELRTRVREAGAGGFGIVNLACHRRPDLGGNLVVRRSNDDQLVRHLNGVVLDWSRTHGVRVFDAYGTLCPGDTYYASVNGVQLYDDGVHYGFQSAPMVFDWLAPQLQAAARTRGTADAGLSP